MKEIDILEIVDKVWKNKRTTMMSGAVGLVLGVVVALNTQKLWTSSVVMAPEVSSSIGVPQSIESIASTVGIDLGKSNNSMDAIYPQIYPDIFASTEFITSLFDIPVTLIDGTTTKTYFNHLISDEKKPFWVYPKLWLAQLYAKKESIPTKSSHSTGVLQYSRKTDNVIQAISNNIACLIDKETNVITVSVTDTDPMVAAIVADTVQNRLQQYITAYRTQKARNDVAYYTKLAAEAKSHYVKARQQYGSYADANTDAILTSVTQKRDEMENNMQLLYNSYSQMQQQLQIARAKVQERTPAFTIIQHPVVPLQASSTPRSMIVFFFTILGMIAGALLIIFRKSTNK